MIGYRPRMRIACCVLVLAGCGSQSSETFLLEAPDCALVNNFTVDGAATPWTDCRIYWSGFPYQTLTVELTVPNTTGSFVSPAPGWMRASLHVPGEVDAELTAAAFESADHLPTTVPDDTIMIDLPIASCGNLGAMTPPADVMADVGDRSVSLSLGVSGSCMTSSGRHDFTGGFILTAAAKAGSDTTGDPFTPVTPEE